MSDFTNPSKQIEIPLLTLWDLFGPQTSGMSHYFRGLQGDGGQLKFKQLIYRAKRGVSAAPSKEILLRIANFFGKQIANKNLLSKIKERPWVLGGQQFVHLFERKDLSYSTGVIFDLLDLDSPDWDIMGSSIDLMKNKLRRIEALNQIVTISQYSKQRILARYDLDPDNIFVIYPGVDANRFQQHDKKYLRVTLGIPEDAIVILYVGSEQRRKNLTTLVEGLGKLVKRYPKVLFIKVGQPQSLQGRIKFKTALDKQNLTNNLKLVDYVADEDLPKWYAIADIFAFPSVGEGFGIPVVEAMSCELPVVTTRCCSIPEITGDAAIFINDPYSGDEWCDTLANVIENSKKGSDLSGKAREQVRKFSWGSSRAQFLKVLGLH